MNEQEAQAALQNSNVEASMLPRNPDIGLVFETGTVYTDILYYVDGLWWIKRIINS